MSKDLRFHLTDEQWQGILFELRNARIGELEKEVARLKGAKEPKKCGCGASVRDVPTHEFPWNCNPSGCLTQPMKDGWHCVVCGEELKP